jgi:hypothetical protein
MDLCNLHPVLAGILLSFTCLGIMIGTTALVLLVHHRAWFRDVLHEVATTVQRRPPGED